MPKPSLSQDYLHRILKYDPETGVFTWLENRRRVRAGDIAGKNSIDTHGYRQIMIDGACYLVGRLAWFYMTGKWPARLLDHKDGNQLNDKWENLREANDSQSAMNRKKRAGGKSKYIGVYPKGMKWEAAICKDYERKRLGTFDTEELAASAYDVAARQMFGAFAKINLTQSQG